MGLPFFRVFPFAPFPPFVFISLDVYSYLVFVVAPPPSPFHFVMIDTASFPLLMDRLLQLWSCHYYLYGRLTSSSYSSFFSSPYYSF